MVDLFKARLCAATAAIFFLPAFDAIFCVAICFFVHLFQDRLF